MPASRSFFLTVPEPDPAVSDVDSQLSARAVAQEAARPVLGRDALASFSTAIDFVTGSRFFDGRPRPGLGAGTWSPGSSVQTRWVRCTSATKVSFASSNPRRKPGSLP